MNWYYFSSEAADDTCAILERTSALDRAGKSAQEAARAEFENICTFLDSIGLPYNIAEEDCYNGDIYLEGLNGKPLMEAL